jgi:hypothetical protein
MEAANSMRALKDLFGFPFRDAKKGVKFLIGSLIFHQRFLSSHLTLDRPLGLCCPRDARQHRWRGSSPA